MARNPEVAVTLTARDDASPKIDRLARKIDGLEADEARVTLTADIGQLERQLERARAELVQLDGDEATVQGRLVGRLEDDLRDARDLFDQLDGETGTVRLESQGVQSVKDDLSSIDDVVANLPGSIGDAAGALSGTGAAGMVGAAGAAAAAVGLIANEVINTATETRIISETLGASVEDAGRLRAVFGDVGIEANDLVDIGLQINDALADDVELADAMGVNIGDALTPAEALRTAVDRWDFLTAEQRSRAFGEEGVRQIARIIATGEDLETLLADVSDTRLLDEDEIRQAEELRQAMAELQGIVDGLVVTLGTDFVPLLADAAGYAALIGDGLGFLRPKIAGVEFDLLKWGNPIGAAVDGITGVFDILGSLRTETQGHIGDLEGAESAATDYGRAVADAVGDATDGLREANEALNDLERDLQTARGALDVSDQFARLRDTAEQAWIETAEGAETAEQSQRDYQRELIDTKLLVREYGQEVLELPAERVTELIALVDEGKLNTAEYLLNLAARKREALIDVSVNYIPRPITLPGGAVVQSLPTPGDGDAIPAQLDTFTANAGGIRPRAATAPTFTLSAAPAGNTFVTVNLPAAASGRDLTRTVSRWANVNGRT